MISDVGCVEERLLLPVIMGSKRYSLNGCKGTTNVGNDLWFLGLFCLKVNLLFVDFMISGSDPPKSSPQGKT